ncbi:EWS RNA-binding protein 1b isoform X6 [Trichomycterus rosablanca]|uniref:EWS RNA-binding protein 1b isoform X6 n=1 Tax=Trichomycterus rosablanca TaxID=2290929 RepID=UPI002F3550F2
MPSLQPLTPLTARLPLLLVDMRNHSMQPHMGRRLHQLHMELLKLELRATVSLLRATERAAILTPLRLLLLRLHMALSLATALRPLILDTASRPPPLSQATMRVVRPPTPKVATPSSLATEDSSRLPMVKDNPSSLHPHPTLLSPMALMVSLNLVSTASPVQLLRAAMISLEPTAGTTRVVVTVALSPHNAEVTEETAPAVEGLTGQGCVGGHGDVGQWAVEAWGPGMEREGPPEQNESENCAIYITGLTEKVTLEDLAEFFKDVGAIRVNRRLGQPAINIYTDRDSGKPKGDATLSYEEPQFARAAVEQHNGKEFQGRKLSVSMAKRKNPQGMMMRGGMPMRGGPPMDRGGFMGRGGERGGFSPRGGPRGGMPFGGPPGGNNVPKRVGDWECASPGCGNQNFAWRTECNQCKAPRPEGMSPPPGGDRGRGGMGRGGRGFERGGPGGMRGGWGGEPGGFRGGRGGMDRGGFRGGSRGGPPMERGMRRGMGPGKMDMRDRHERRERPY